MPILQSYFNGLDDPRTGNAKRHKFSDLMTISLLCALCGGETAVDMVDFCIAKEDFLRQYLELSGGLPCHDTFSCLFRMIKPDAFEVLFDKFREDFAQARDDIKAVAMDGKEIRRAFDKASEQSGVNMVTAFAHGARLSLGIAQGQRGGSEIFSLRELVSKLELKGMMITADALHCQRETCELLVEEGADYCLQLKGNQRDMKQDIMAFVADHGTDIVDRFKTVDGDHGRIETRSYEVYDIPQYLHDMHQWPHLKAFVHVATNREKDGKISQSERLYLLSKQLSAEEAEKIIRGHWQIENNLHWTLDMVMNEDQHRARKDHAPVNFAALRRIALNIIKRNKEKGSNRVKFKRAGWSDRFLASLLQDF